MSKSKQRKPHNYPLKQIEPQLWDRMVKESQITDVSINKLIKQLLDKRLPK